MPTAGCVVGPSLASSCVLACFVAQGGLELAVVPLLQPSLFRSVGRISYDPARFPRYLPEAYCLCRGCLTGLFGEEDFRYRSAPVYSPAVVLRRTAACAGGRSVYAEHYVTIPVGCTCVPEPDKASDSANSSMDKPGAKLLFGPNNRPTGR